MTRTLTLIVPLMLAATPALARPHQAPVDPDVVATHVHDALDEVGATPAQQVEVGAVLDERLPALFAYREQAHSLHDRFHDLFEAATIDRVALEDTRMDLVDLFDRASETALTTLADLADLVSPEQRQQLRELRDQHRSRWAHHLHHPRGPE